MVLVGFQIRYPDFAKVFGIPFNAVCENLPIGVIFTHIRKFTPNTLIHPHEHYFIRNHIRLTGFTKGIPIFICLHHFKNLISKSLIIDKNFGFKKVLPENVGGNIHTRRLYHSFFKMSSKKMKNKGENI